MAFLLAWAVAVPPGVEEGVARADDGMPPRAPRTVEDLDVAPTGSEGTQAAPPFEYAQGTASLLTFQSFQDGNWEIYLAVNDTGVTRRLTADPASDLEPKISPDLTRVVFTSRRTGNYDLFSVNVDGTGLVQLTSDAATDSAATWSPDGSRLAFQSRRTGNDEVFVMNADGSGLRQLTTNFDYDGEPAWSPDGREIAFISRRTPGDQTYFLYVMNADGGGQRLLASLPYSSRPAWSYVGKRILFDAFDPSAGQRLFLYDFANGSVGATGHFPVSSYRYADVMAGSWGIGDNAFVTLISYAPVNGQWVIAGMEMWQIDVARSWIGGGIGPGLSGFPSWGNPDTRPPVTTAWFPETPAKSWNTIEVRVTGSDVGIAGLGGFELQTRRAPGDGWSNVSVNCGHYEGYVWRCYVPSLDGALQVRAIGIDNYGNREQWSDDPARWASTRLYNRRLSGQVRDIRGNALANVSIAGIPSQIGGPITTDAAGNWLGFESYANAYYTVTASLPAATASLRANLLQPMGETWNLRGDFDLIASDNVIANSGFDAPGSAWAPLGLTEPGWLSAEAASANSALVRLGGETVSTRLMSSFGTPMVARVSSTTYIAYPYFSDSVTIFACPAGQACSGLTTTYGQLYAFGAAPDGTLAIIARNFGAYELRRRTPDGVWQAAESVPFGDYTAGRALLADSTGRWHFVWVDGTGAATVSHRADGGGWSSGDSLGSMHAGFAAAFEAGDVLRVVNCSSEGVIQRTWSAWTGVSAPTTLSPELCEYNVLSTLIDDEGTSYAVWISGGEYRYSRHPAGGSWGAPVPLAGAAPGMSGAVPGTGGRPRVAIQVGTDRIGLAEVAPTGDWVALNVRTMTVPYAATISQLLHTDLVARTLVSQDSTPLYPGTLFELNAYTLVNGDGDFGISQIVSIPADMMAPTFYVRYRFVADNPNDSLSLRVQAGDAPTPTTLSLPAQGGWVWATQWFDASAWAGKTITLTAVLHDGGGSLSSADLDTIALASWNTPVVSAVSPTEIVKAGDTFTITGDCFVPTTAVLVGGHATLVTLIDAQHLSVTLPADYGVGFQPVIVVNPGGFAAQAAQTLYVGSDRLMLPVLLRWTP